MTLSSYLVARKKSSGAKHSHTWFAAPRSSTVTLSIADKDVPELRKQLVTDVSGRTCLRNGANSITEKVTRGTSFRFFADLDFAPDKILHWKTQSVIPSDELHVALQAKLVDIITLHKSVVSELVGTPQSQILTTRLPYKIHLHYPDVVVDAKGAKLLCRTFALRFAQQHPDLFDKDVVDESVYTSGLRMLYCHKGGMVRDDKLKLEKEKKAIHESMFGAGSYCDVYYVTNPVTWLQNRTPSIDDLHRTSIQVDPATPLTLLIQMGAPSPVIRKAKEKEKGKAKSYDDDQAGVVDDQGIRLFLARASSIAVESIRTEEKSIRGNTLIVPTRCRQCPFAKREHNGNQQYFVLTSDGAEQRCHDQECPDSKHYKLDSEVREAVAKLLGDDTIEVISCAQTQTQEDRLLAFRGVLSQPIGNKSDIAKMNLTPAQETMTPMGYWTCTLPRNRYCPVCRSVHDRPENFMQISPLGHRGIGCNLRHGEFYPDPLTTIPAATINVLFNNTFITVNNNSTEVEVRDFGAYETFPAVHEDKELNRLCHASLTGRTRSVAHYVRYLMDGQYIYQDRKWYEYDDNSWHEGIQPDSLFTDTVTSIYEQLQNHFQLPKQRKWLNQLIDELGNVTRRKAFIEDLERVVLKTRVRYPLDEKANLLGFQNGVFDAITGEFRQIRPNDYLSQLIPYDVPETSVEAIEREIEQFFNEIMPNQIERDFLWLMLSLHLKGRNAHSAIMVWSGSGANGKSALAELMKLAFQQFYDGQQGTYLTTERPSPENPSALLMSQRLKRCVCALEPDSGKKCNTSFIKFISGGDLIQARALNSNDYVSYYPRFLVTMLCNEVPSFNGAASEIRGLWRRIIIFKFPTEFEAEPTKPHHRKIDPDLNVKMERWAPYFMRMLMRVYQRYLANGCQFLVPAEVQSNVDEEKELNNPMETWLSRHLVKVPGATFHAHRFDRAYERWLIEWRGEQQGRSQVGNLPKGGFIKLLESRGYVVSAYKDNHRDNNCCASSARIVHNIDVSEEELDPRMWT